MARRPQHRDFPHLAGDDLGDVVLNLAPRATRGGAAERDPNESLVRWLLEAGVVELSHRFSDFSPPDDAASIPAYGSVNDLIGTVSLAEVMTRYRELCQAHGQDPGQANKALILRRWQYASRYQRDLVAFVFRPSFHRARMATIESDLARMTQTHTLGTLVETLAVTETDAVQSQRLLQLQLALVTAFPTHPEIQQRASESYAAQAAAWARIYARIDRCYGLGLTASGAAVFSDLAILLSTVVEGAHLRRQARAVNGELSDGSHVAVALVQHVLVSMTGVPWSQLAVRSATSSTG
ncbi:MAG: hypothetical protein CMH83_13520 [Nocardioides sp.]|nr:hypothetical protein [Nocardioides sp.]